MKTIKTQHIILSCGVCWIAYYVSSLVSSTILRSSTKLSNVITLDSILFLLAVALTSLSAVYLVVRFALSILGNYAIKALSDIKESEHKNDH